MRLFALTLTYCEIQPRNVIQVLPLTMREGKQDLWSQWCPAWDCWRTSEIIWALFVQFEQHFSNNLSYNDIWWLFSLTGDFLQKYLARSWLELDIPVTIIPWGSTFGEKTGEHWDLFPAPGSTWCPLRSWWCPGFARRICRAAQGSPHPLIDAPTPRPGPHLCSCLNRTSRWAFGHLWLSQVVFWPPGGTQAISVFSNSHCQKLLSGFEGNSALPFYGFYPSGVLPCSRRTQVLRGKCPRENFAGSRKTWSF